MRLASTRELAGHWCCTDRKGGGSGSGSRRTRRARGMERLPVPQPASQMVVPSTPPSAAWATVQSSMAGREQCEEPSIWVCVLNKLCCPAGHPADQAGRQLQLLTAAAAPTLVQPAQDLVHGLGVPSADVQLHLQHHTFTQAVHRVAGKQVVSSLCFHFCCRLHSTPRLASTLLIT